uniref:Uncharacterized protein n=1 Tax=Romanomermis culicivorax TaxID=13658 RepID=A0A915HIJ2_ROMCU
MEETLRRMQIRKLSWLKFVKEKGLILNSKLSWSMLPSYGNQSEVVLEIAGVRNDLGNPTCCLNDWPVDFISKQECGYNDMKYPVIQQTVHDGYTLDVLSLISKCTLYLDVFLNGTYKLPIEPSKYFLNFDPVERKFPPGMRQVEVNCATDGLASYDLFRIFNTSVSQRLERNTITNSSDKKYLSKIKHKIVKQGKEKDASPMGYDTLLSQYWPSVPKTKVVQRTVERKTL